MQNSSSRFRFVVKLWLLASLACVVWNLVPVFAKYRLDQQKLADLEEQRRHPPVATVEVAQDSPWPGSTIDMRGRAIAGLDDQNLPMADIKFGQLGQMVVTSSGVSLIDT